MTCIGQCGWGALASCGPNGCHQKVAIKGSEGIKRRAAYSSPLHAPGGSLTPCVSSRIFLHYPKPLFPTRTLQQCKKTSLHPLLEGRGCVVVIVTGNPGVFFSNPYLYPRDPYLQPDGFLSPRTAKAAQK